MEEIRRLRGSITRRTAKTSGNAKQDREGSQCTPQTTSPVNYNSPAGEKPVDINATPAEGIRFQLNTPNWQSTGVINGLPGSSTVSSALENITPTTGKRIYSSIETAAAKDMVGLRGDLGHEKDTAKALELALREVLDSIKAARYVGLSPWTARYHPSDMAYPASSQRLPYHRSLSTSNLIPSHPSSFTSFPRLPYCSPPPSHSQHRTPFLSLLPLTIHTSIFSDPRSHP